MKKLVSHRCLAKKTIAKLEKEIVKHKKTIGSLERKNAKTGKGLAQLFILVEDVNPLDAILAGLDEGICGGCAHRGQWWNDIPRTCYVDVGKSVVSVWNAYRRGSYQTMRPPGRTPKRVKRKTKTTAATRVTQRTWSGRPTSATSPRCASTSTFRRPGF